MCAILIANSSMLTYKIIFIMRDVFRMKEKGNEIKNKGMSRVSWDFANKINVELNMHWKLSSTRRYSARLFW